MTVQEAKRIIARTSSSYLKRDMQRFIRNQREKGGPEWPGKDSQRMWSLPTGAST